MQRQRNNVTVIERIAEEKGLEWIKDTWTTALLQTIGLTPNYPTPASFQHVYDALVRTRQYIGIPAGPPPTLANVHGQYMVWAHMSPCMIYTGQSQNGYPVVSTRLENNDSVKLTLHMCPSLIAQNFDDNGNRLPGQAWYPGVGDVASHPCHHKMCISCGYTATRDQNRTRNYCRPLALINDQLHIICFCNPVCTDLSSTAYTDI